MTQPSWDNELFGGIDNDEDVWAAGSIVPANTHDVSTTRNDGRGVPTVQHQALHPYYEQQREILRAKELPRDMSVGSVPDNKGGTTIIAGGNVTISYAQDNSARTATRSETSPQLPSLPQRVSDFWMEEEPRAMWQSSSGNDPIGFRTLLIALVILMASFSLFALIWTWTRPGGVTNVQPQQQGRMK